MPSTSWNETIRIVLRLLDIECENHKNGCTVVRNPVSMYRHIKDDYMKSKLKDEDIVFNLKRSNKLPPYTNGYKIIEKKEVEDWILPGINPDINGINPMNCHESGFTKMSVIRPEKNIPTGLNDTIRDYSSQYLSDNFHYILNNEV